MSDRRVALLRGINVGKAKRIAMADLRTVVEELGHEDVRTVLNSGNVVFSVGRKAGAAAVDTKIARSVEEKLGVTSRVTVLTAEEVTRVLAENTLRGTATDPSCLLVVVLARASFRSRLLPLLEARWTRERIALGTRAAYLWCPDGVLKSPLAAAVAKILGDDGTARNLTTMDKIRAAVIAE